MTVEIRDIWPDRATYRPGEPARIVVALAQAGSEHTCVQAQLRLTWLHHVAADSLHSVALAPASETRAELPLSLPSTSFRGYGVTVTLRDDAGGILAEGATALDVLERWSQAPRYGFFSDFAPGGVTADAHVEALSRYHINVAQFYDWMWRHYELMPPTEEFKDALGRTLSLRTVRTKVAACQRAGMATYGYAAVYGAELEYAQAHPDEMVYDADGKPYSLGELFYIMNLTPHGPWRDRMLETMRDAVRDVPFDGLHLDQYGFPRASVFDADGRPYDFAPDFASFIDAARSAIQQPGRDTGVIFNAVENWPIERVAPTSQDAVYIEVWPPFIGYEHLRSLIFDAQRLAPEKQVILAAYMKPLGETTDAATQVEAEAATLLTSATIWAHGGSHLLLGEQDAALHDPYYVRHTRLRPEFAKTVRAYYDFVVRYLNLLCDRRLAAVAAEEAPAVRVTLAGQRVSVEPEAGAVWAIERRAPDSLTISLINLTAATTTEWNAPTPPPTPLTRLATTLRLTGVSDSDAPAVRGVFAATPDDGAGAMAALPYSTTRVGDGVVDIIFETPSLRYWTLLVIELEERPAQAEKGHA